MPCSYEQSKCNREAGSRLLHPLAQELPLLQGLLSSPSDTANDWIREALKCWFSKSMRHYLPFQSTSPGTVSLVLLEAHMPECQGMPCPCAARTICCVSGLICTWVAGLTPTKWVLANNSVPKLPLNMLIFSPGRCFFHGPERAQKRALLTETGKNITKWIMGETRAHKSNWYLCNSMML